MFRKRDPQTSLLSVRSGPDGQMPPGPQPRSRADSPRAPGRQNGGSCERIKYGSIVVVERFNRTLKYEGLFLITIPFSLDRMRQEVRLIVEHYNRHRPSTGLTGRTPDEVYFDREPAIEKHRWEPRAKWPRTSGCAMPYVPVKGECGARLELEVRYLEGRSHLPIFRLKEAA